MEPIIEIDWLGNYKNVPVDESTAIGNVAKSWQWRERGLDPPHCVRNKTVLENIAEDTLVQKVPLNIRCCDLPGYPRSTFLMVFSPDGTKVASTHGNHNVYVSELSSGKHVRILKGHPRTPWCIAFHPSHAQLIGSGCLGGQVRVWDFLSGGSEVWTVSNETVIASIAFHPRDQLLVIATYNELYFWDWSQPAPFTKVSTNNINEKVRYVAFDALGYKLITGISVWSSPGGSSSLLQSASQSGPPNSNGTSPSNAPNNNQSNRQQDGSGTTQELIVTSYQNLVQRYDSLVRNYHRLFLARSQSANTMDRGTDPMEMDLSNERRPSLRPISSRLLNATRLLRGTSPRASEDNRESETPASSRLLDFDVLSLGNNNPTATAAQSSQESTQSQTTAAPRPLQDGQTIFGSRPSAFQPLLAERNERRYAGGHYTRRHNRVLPNPFFYGRNFTSMADRLSAPPTFSLSSFFQSGSSRTSVFTPYRTSTSVSPMQIADSSRRNSFNNPTNDRPPPAHAASRPIPWASRPTESATNLSTQTPVAAQAITESLDLIRDILRDSGTRLLNLITDMSLSSLACEDRTMLRRNITSARTRSDEGERSRLRNRPTSRVTLFSSQFRRELISSASESDSDHSLEVNIYRTRNASFSEQSAETTERGSTTDRPLRPTSRMVVDLDMGVNSVQPNPELPLSQHVNNNNRINITVSNNRFRLRTNNTNDETPVPLAAERSSVDIESSPSVVAAAAQVNPAQDAPLDFTSRPSTSRDNFWMEDSPRNDRPPTDPPLTPSEAFRKVKLGITTLKKHTEALTARWMGSSPTTMRELRTMWEDLRRHIVALHRQTSRHDTPSYYARSILERCRILTEMSTRANSSNTETSENRNSPRNMNTATTPESEVNTNTADSNRADMSTSSRESPQVVREPPTNTPTETASRPSLPRSNQTWSRNRRSNLASVRSALRMRNSPTTRRRLQSTNRVRTDEERRRLRIGSIIHHWCLRPGNRLRRRDNVRPIELHCTRHEIRLRAMQVLSIMFNIMMACLEESELSSHIITMLRTLKRALGLTCLLLMTNRFTRRDANSNQSSRSSNGNTTNRAQTDNSAPAARSSTDINVESELEVAPESENTNSANNTLNSSVQDAEIEQTPITPLNNVTTSDQVMDENNDSNSTSSWPTSETSNNDDEENMNKSQKTEKANARTQNNNDSTLESNIRAPQEVASHRWSNRLAVQISAANKNNTVTASDRKDIYLESKRQKALHKYNPLVHPLAKQKSVPPLNAHRIPNPRYMPTKRRISKPPKPISLSSNTNDPVAGPSNLNTSSPNDLSSLVSQNRQEYRANLLRLAQFHAARLRNATRNRYRIRLYTPSSVREMFDMMHSGSSDNQTETPPPRNNPSEESITQRTYASHHPRLLTVRNDREHLNGGQGDGNRRFDTILNNVAVPLVQVNDLPVNEAQGSFYTPPRVHEYLQPIILAQNALVVDEGGGGGGGPGGELLEAGLVSEALPAPAHRVQAWDFTWGAAPQIQDSTKNVVVKRCRIHNDASIDISRDGKLLVALLPVPRLRHTNHRLGVYSLEWGNLGQCLHTAALEQSAVSVALSPTARHLAVGLGSRRVTLLPHSRNNVFALLFRLSPNETSSRTGLAPIRVLDQNWEHGFTSLNCLRWAPQPGQGLVYANNTGQLIVMS